MNIPKMTVLFVRLPIAMSFLCHGLVRLPKLHGFATGMAEQFAGTLLPGHSSSHSLTSLCLLN